MIKKTLQELMAAGHALNQPFSLEVGDNHPLQIEKVLRVLPGKRVVVKAIRNEAVMLTKIFFHSRNFQQELNGYQQLEKTGVKTPRLISQKILPEGGVCNYQFIENAISFGVRWKSSNEATKRQLLEKLLATLENLYSNGLFQADIHLDNFIFSQDDLYALDPAGCKKLDNKETKMNNLALLVTQFPFSDWQLVSNAITEKFRDINMKDLDQRVPAQHKTRCIDFLKKIYRECTYIHRWRVEKKRGQHLLICCVRELGSADMERLLENMDKVPDAAETLKSGNSSVVSSCIVDGKKIVVKNSRNKNIWRLLRRSLRRSRASNSWYFSHLLRDEGINIPAPIALVERKFGPFVLESWFVSECIEGDNLLDVWLYQKPSTWELAATAEIFATLQRLNISHGDMKATNLLVKDNKIWLIDYDGMQQHRNKDTAQKALAKDRERFLQNWPKLNLEKLIAVN